MNTPACTHSWKRLCAEDGEHSPVSRSAFHGQPVLSTKKIASIAARLGSLPDRGEWQGVFVLPGYEQRGRAMLRAVREANRQPGMQGSTQMNNGLPGLTDADQLVVGLLSAGLAELFAMGQRQLPPAPAQVDAIMAGVGAATWGLWKSSGQRWLLSPARVCQAETTARQGQHLVEAGQDGLVCPVVRHLPVSTISAKKYLCCLFPEGPAAAHPLL